METKNLTKLIIKQQISSKSLEKHIHRSYILSKQRDYELCWENKVNGSVTYNGNIYLLNYQTWFHGCYLNHKPHFMNTNIRPKDNTKEFRIVDILLYQSAVTHLNDQYGLKNGHYKECIFALTDRGYLRQYFTDCSSGTWKLHRKIYLSRKYGFKNLSYDKEFDRFVVKSIHDPNGRQSPIRFYFALFYPAPFSFIGIFGLKDELFGKIQDAFLVQELLVITTKKKTLFYDFKQLLDINTFEHIDINKTQFGTYPNELPINIEITQFSPCLFILETSNMSSLSFGGYPYHCILQKGGDTSVYFVHSAPDAKLIGKVEATSSDGFDSRFSYFHTDQSGRIVCVERDRIEYVIYLLQSMLSFNFSILLYKLEKYFGWLMFISWPICYHQSTLPVNDCNKALLRIVTASPI